MSVFFEFDRISETYRPSKSGRGYTRHGNSVSDFLVCNLRLDESKLPLSLSLIHFLFLSIYIPVSVSPSFSLRTTLRKCIIELASGCAPLTPLLEARRAIVRRVRGQGVRP